MANGASWICPALADSTSRSIRFCTPSNTARPQKTSTMTLSVSIESYARSKCFRGPVGGVPSVSTNPFESRSRRNIDLASSPSNTILQATSIWGVFLSSALAISALVRHVCTSIRQADQTYHQIYTHARERKLLRRRADLELNLEELKFAEDAAKRLGTAMGFKGMDDLRRLTDNPVVQMKILLSLFRRVRGLAEFQNSDQIKFDE